MCYDQECQIDINIHTDISTNIDIRIMININLGDISVHLVKICQYLSSTKHGNLFPPTRMRDIFSAPAQHGNMADNSNPLPSQLIKRSI